jgi:hypothetical protein
VVEILLSYLSTSLRQPPPVYGSGGGSTPTPTRPPSKVARPTGGPPGPAVRELAAAVPSVAESLAAFNRHILPMEWAPGTRGKYLTHRWTILTWAVWKGVLPRLLPMSDDLLRAFLWDALAFQASLSVLQQAIKEVLAWHDRLRLEPPLNGTRAYKRLIHSLSRFQGVQRRIFLPVYAGAVKRLMSLKLPGHPSCQGLRGGCAICMRHLFARRNCLAGAT